MNLRTSLIIVWTLLASVTACKHQLDAVSPTLPTTSTNPSNPDVGTITEIGQPQGTPTSQLIGPQGGTIRSTDGAIELAIPAGALTTATTITIQPITNQAPNGVGLAYRFSPDGTQFAKAARLTFHYDAANVAVNDPDMLAAGFQQTDRRWQRAADVSVDTTNRSISVSMPHFSDWTAYELERIKDLDLAGGPGKGKVLDLGQSATIGVTETFWIAPLTETKHETFEVKDIHWSVVGGNANGQVTTKGANLNATYTAPSKYPPQNPVTVQAEISFINSSKKVYLYKRILIGHDYFTGTFDGVAFNWSEMVCTNKNGVVIINGNNGSSQSLNIMLNLNTSEKIIGSYPYAIGFKLGTAFAEYTAGYGGYNGFISFMYQCYTGNGTPPPPPPIVSGGNVTITQFDDVDGVTYIKGYLSGTFINLPGPCPTQVIQKPIKGEFRIAVAN